MLKPNETITATSAALTDKWVPRGLGCHTIHFLSSFPLPSTCGASSGDVESDLFDGSCTDRPGRPVLPVVLRLCLRGLSADAGPGLFGL